MKSTFGIDPSRKGANCLNVPSVEWHSPCGFNSGGLKAGPRHRKDWFGNAKEKPVKHPVDVHVGKRVRHRRWMVGMTQQQLAEKVGIKFQQIQKYETGMNRVSASRLWDIAEALSVSVSYFFEGMEGSDIVASDKDAKGSDLPNDILADKEALELIRSYYAIPENQRRRLFELARVLSDAAA
jgi:transcriptional regulator with XRE-family HTH domain